MACCGSETAVADAERRVAHVPRDESLYWAAICGCSGDLPPFSTPGIVREGPGLVLPPFLYQA